MKAKITIQNRPVSARIQPPDIRRRIDNGWLRLWRAVYPNMLPPVIERMRESTPTKRLMRLCLAAPETLAAVDRFQHFEVILKSSKCKNACGYRRFPMPRVPQREVLQRVRGQSHARLAQ
jgi:hypothetical protein